MLKQFNRKYPFDNTMYLALFSVCIMIINISRFGYSRDTLNYTTHIKYIYIHCISNLCEIQLSIKS